MKRSSLCQYSENQARVKAYAWNWEPGWNFQIFSFKKKKVVAESDAMWQIPRKYKPAFAYDGWAEILANTYREDGSLSLTGGEEREYVTDIAKEVCVCTT